MRKRLLFCFVAMAAFIFTACEKEPEQPAEPQIPQNTLTYDGKTYNMVPVLEIYNSQLTMLTATSKEKAGNGEPKIVFDHFHIRSSESYSMWNSTTDLANPGENDSYEITFSGEVLNLIGRGDHSYAEGMIDGEVYQNQSVFNSGTLKVIGQNDGSGVVTVEIDCVLKNGKTLKMSVHSDHVTT